LRSPVDKPGPPVGPLEVTDIHKEGCKIHWNKPKDNGGLPITGYLVEKMDTATGKWVPAGFVDPSATEHTINGLEPNRKYNFRVKALNEEGESVPLETDASILTKNPYGNRSLLRQYFSPLRSSNKYVSRITVIRWALMVRLLVSKR